MQVCVIYMHVGVCVYVCHKDVPDTSPSSPFPGCVVSSERRLPVLAATQYPHPPPILCVTQWTPSVDLMLKGCHYWLTLIHDSLHRKTVMLVFVTNTVFSDLLMCVERSMVTFLNLQIPRADVFVLYDCCDGI